MKISLIAGLILASPWVLYQLWKFIAAGLYKHERRAVYILAPFSSIMTALGVLFTYFVMLPICLAFLVGFAVDYPLAGEGFSFIDRMVQVGDTSGGDAIDQGNGQPAAPAEAPPTFPALQTDPDKPTDGQMWLKLPEHELRLYSSGRVWSFRPTTNAGVMPFFGLGEYTSFALLMMLGIVIGFQLPVAMTIFGWTGLVDPKWFKRYRKHAFIICFILGAFLTPSDPLSMFILAVPLYLLFEFGLVCMRMAFKRATADVDAEP
jgi:sec-independent protein translocase protein TatC